MYYQHNRPFWKEVSNITITLKYRLDFELMIGTPYLALVAQVFRQKVVTF